MRASVRATAVKCVPALGTREQLLVQRFLIQCAFVLGHPCRNAQKTLSASRKERFAINWGCAERNGKELEG